MLSVHDELILEVEASRVEAVRARVHEAMVSAWPGLRVPLAVTLKQGISWGDLAEVRV